jgi:2-hydroxy-3-keto-5-methylthiopentenyl-1-phosphate phosphatase
MYDRIVFVDFDGTVTSEETLSGLLMRMNPRGCESVIGDMLSEKITLAEGLNIIFGMIPSSRENEIEDYISTVPLRPGFEEFLLYCKSLDVPVVILSGGIRQMVDYKTRPFRDLILDVYSVELDTSGETMRMVSDNGNDKEFMDKPMIMERYQYKKAICIGDGYTDFSMAEISDVVFARDQLAKHMDEADAAYYPWEDYFDIIRILKKI